MTAAANRIEWESHYEGSVSLVGFESFDKMDLDMPYVRRLLRHGKTATRALEFGSGKGGLSLTLKRQCQHVETHLLDFSGSAVEFSRALFKHYGVEGHFYEGSFLALPFPNGHFDLIHGNTVLEHVEDTAAAVRELSRVLTPGGVALITVPNRRRRYDGHDLYHYVARFRYYSKTFWPAELDGLWESENCRVEDRFGATASYFFPSFLPAALLETVRRRRGVAPQDGGAGAGDMALATATPPTSAGTARGMGRLKKALLRMDAAWGPAQAQINRVLTNRELLPSSWYVTIGIVARKSK